MISFLKSLFSKAPSISLPKSYTGANLDARPVEAKVNDVHFSEVVGTAAPVVWVEKKIYRQFPSLDQKSTFECGAFSARKALGIMYSTYPQYGSYVDFSSSDIYKQRSSAAGMSFPEIFAAWSAGVTLQALVNDSPRTDADTDNLVIPTWMRGVGAQFAITGGVYLPNDIDTIASVIQATGKGVILLTYFLAGEWGQYVPTIADMTLRYDEDRALRHFAVAVDSTLYGGSKALVIEDSAHFGGLDRRIVTEAWVKSRVISAGYPMNFKFMPAVGSRPTYDGGTTISLQQCLRYDGEFPQNVALVESFGPVTRNALIAFQVKYGLPQSATLDGASKNKLHQLFP